MKGISYMNIVWQFVHFQVNSGKIIIILCAISEKFNEMFSLEISLTQIFSYHNFLIFRKFLQNLTKQKIEKNYTKQNLKQIFTLK